MPVVTTAVHMCSTIPLSLAQSFEMLVLRSAQGAVVLAIN